MKTLFLDVVTVKVSDDDIWKVNITFYGESISFTINEGSILSKISLITALVFAYSENPDFPCSVNNKDNIVIIPREYVKLSDFIIKGLGIKETDIKYIET